MKTGDKVKVMDWRSEFHGEIGEVTDIVKDSFMTWVLVEFEDTTSIRHFCKCDVEVVKPKRDRSKANANRKAKEDILKSCGLTKVHGALGGVYWE
jgi:hypothetical protein